MKENAPSTGISSICSYIARAKTARVILVFAILASSSWLLFHGTKKSLVIPSPELTHVIVPFFISELEAAKNAIEIWNEFTPCGFSRSTFSYKPALVLILALNDKTTRNESSMAKNSLVASLKSLSPSARVCFSHLSIEIITLIGKENEPYFGTGIIFEKIVSRDLDALKKAKVVAHLHPVCRPVQKGWLNLLSQNAASFGPFLMRGSAFVGNIKLMDPLALSYKAYIQHINRNALYDISGDELKNLYLNSVRPYVEKKLRSSDRGINGYAVGNGVDVDIWEYLHDPSNTLDTRDIIGKYQYTNVIRSMWMTEYSPEDYLRQYPETLLVCDGIQI